MLANNSTIVNSRLVKFIYRKFKNILFIILIVVVVYCLSLLWIIKKIHNLKNEVQLANTRVANKNITVNPNTVELINDNVVKLKQFLPDELNVLQTIQLIEQIGSKTKFKIEQYSIKYSETGVGSLVMKPLELAGSGTMEQFLSFIKQYKYITGQILSVDTVSIVGRERVLSNLSVNVYVYTPSIDLASEVRALDEVDQAILEKIRMYVTSKKTFELEDDYTSAENPFK